MKFDKWLIAFASFFALAVFSGCPDRSYMRPEPDWTKQADGSEKKDVGDEDSRDPEGMNQTDGQ